MRLRTHASTHTCVPCPPPTLVASGYPADNSAYSKQLLPCSPHPCVHTHMCPHTRACRRAPPAAGASFGQQRAQPAAAAARPVPRVCGGATGDVVDSAACIAAAAARRVHIHAAGHAVGRDTAAGARAGSRAAHCARVAQRCGRRRGSTARAAAAGTPTHAQRRAAQGARCCVCRSQRLGVARRATHDAWCRRAAPRMTPGVGAPRHA
eukprot:360908-Chlamydomonas_euryale.AAC.8